MDQEWLRLECLKLASLGDYADRAGKSVVDLARDYFNFVQAMVELPSTDPAWYERSHA